MEFAPIAYDGPGSGQVTVVAGVALKRIVVVRYVLDVVSGPFQFWSDSVALTGDLFNEPGFYDVGNGLEASGLAGNAVLRTPVSGESLILKTSGDGPWRASGHLVYLLP